MKEKILYKKKNIVGIRQRYRRIAEARDNILNDIKSVPSSGNNNINSVNTSKSLAKLEIIQDNVCSIDTQNAHNDYQPLEGITGIQDVEIQFSYAHIHP